MRDGTRASEVITRLRALFSKRAPTAESVDLNESTREVIALLHGELQKNRVIVQTELAGELPLVTGDRVQLQQVVLNLTFPVARYGVGLSFREVFGIEFCDTPQLAAGSFILLLNARMP